MNIIDGFYENNVIFFVCRDNFNKFIKKITNFDWYFYVDRNFYLYGKKNPDFIKKFKEYFSINKIVIEKPYIKIYTDYEKAKKPNGVLDYLKKLNLKTYEADVNPLKRLLIDNDDISISNTYKILYIDIETDDRKDDQQKDEIVVGAKKILSIAGFENENTHFVFCSDDEIEILTRALQKFKEYDILVGWNSKKFDIPYIQKRLEFYKKQNIDIEKKINFDWRHVIIIDLMWRFKHVYQHDSTLTSYSLERVSQHFSIGGKLNINNEKIYNLFINDRDRLKEYNLQDCRLLYLLENRLKIIDQMIATARYCRTFLSTFYITELLDNLLLYLGKKYRIHLSTKEFVKEKTDFTGGFVLEPKIGLHENVVIFDAISLYPNLIRTFNISPDSLVSKGPNVISSAKSNVYFDKTKLGLIPLAAEYLLKNRETIKQKILKFEKENNIKNTEYENLCRDDKVIKELNNSLYGTFGSVHSRYYNIDLAESITLAGQFIIKFAKSYFENLGFSVVAGDTDSIMISIPEGTDPLFLLENFHKNLDSILISTFNINKNFVRFKYERLFSKFIVVKKKNYAGRLIMSNNVAKDEIYAKGLELIKKDTIEYTRKKLKELLYFLLYEDHNVEFFDNFIKKEYDEIETKKFEAEDICITKRISKEFELYKTVPMHVKLAKKLWESQNKEFFVGMDLRYIVVNNKDKENKAIWINHFKGEFDRSYYWEHIIYPPLKRILITVFPNYDWSKYDHSKNSNIKRKQLKV